jgi:hypothetical protein
MEYFAVQFEKFIIPEHIIFQKNQLFGLVKRKDPFWQLRDPTLWGRES